MQKHLEKMGENTFDKIFNQKLGGFWYTRVSVLNYHLFSLYLPYKIIIIIIHYRSKINQKQSLFRDTKMELVNVVVHKYRNQNQSLSNHRRSLIHTQMQPLLVDEY
jgi:hypothetical protein